MELYELRQKQSLPLAAKIVMSQQRIREWYDYWDGNVYVSFSGGKDSTVLLHLVRSLYPNVPAAYVDTGLEFPAIRKFVRTVDNVIWLRPEKSFQQIVQEYGYPVVSKDIARTVYSLIKAATGPCDALRGRTRMDHHLSGMLPARKSGKSCSMRHSRSAISAACG